MFLTMAQSLLACELNSTNSWAVALNTVVRLHSTIFCLELSFDLQPYKSPTQTTLARNPPTINLDFIHLDK